MLFLLLLCASESAALHKHSQVCQAVEEVGQVRRRRRERERRMWRKCEQWRWRGEEGVDYTEGENKVAQ